MSYELRHLRYAITAADHRSLRRAAEVLHLKQSTLSRCVRELEQQLEVILFERSRAGVRPTPAGVVFLAAARRILQGVEAITRIAKDAGHGAVGRLRLGFYDSLSAGNLRATLSDYAQRYPAVELRAVESSREHLFDDIKIGALDIVIVTGDPIGTECQAMALWSERIFVALPEGHSLAARDIITWGDLKGETFLLEEHDPGPDVHDLLIAKLAAPGDRPKVINHHISQANIKALVGLGCGVTLVCESCLGAHYAGVIYREVRDSNGACRIGYTAHWNRDNANPALVTFLKLLQERHPVLPEVR